MPETAPEIPPKAIKNNLYYQMTILIVIICTKHKICSMLIMCVMCFYCVRIQEFVRFFAPRAKKGSNSNKAPGGGAPIDAGLGISLALVAGFGAWKLLQALQKKKQSV
jgi:hypothetical protein